MTHIHRFVLAGLLLSTPACRSQETTLAPDVAEMPVAGVSAGEEPGMAEPQDTKPDTVASAPVAAPPEVLAVRTVVRTAEHDRLAAMEGRFEVLGSFHPRPDTLARPVQGTLETTWLEETASLEGTFEGTLWGAPFAYVSATGYDPTLGCWVETWRTAEGEPIRTLAQGYDSGDGCVVTVRHEDGRTVRDEIHFGENDIVRRIWRTTADGVEYLSLELNGRRVD